MNPHFVLTQWALAIQSKYKRSHKNEWARFRLASTGANAVSIRAWPTADSTLFFEFAEGSTQQVGSRQPPRNDQCPDQESTFRL